MVYANYQCRLLGRQGGYHLTELAEKLSDSTAKKNYSLITAILLWCGLAVVSGMYVTIPMVSIFVREFAVSPAQAAWSTSAFSFAYALGFLLFGPLSDRYGRKQVMFWGLVALCFITPLLGVANSFPWLITLRTMQGIAAATFAPSALAFVVEIYPAEKRVTAIGFVSTGFLMAGIVGQVLSGLVSQSMDWPYVFYYLGGFYLLSTCLLGGFIPKGEKQQTNPGVFRSFQQMGRVLFQRSLFFCYLITLTLLLSFVGMYATLGNYLSQAPFALDSNQILMVRAAGIVGMLLSPFAGRFVARFGALKVLQAGLLLAMLGLGVMGISSSLPFLILMSVLFVAGISITVPTLISLVGSIGGQFRGVAVSLYTFILFIGATLGPIVSSQLLKSNSYTVTFGGLAILLGIAFLFSFLVRKNNQK